MTTLSDRDVLALTVYGEARGESLEGKAAVANVVRNRLKSGRFGRSIESVCLKPFAFSCWRWEGGEQNHSALKELANQIQQGNQPNDPVLKECYGIADGIISGWLRDNTLNATHYYVTVTKMPVWAKNQVPTVVIGAHSFFAGIA